MSTHTPGEWYAEGPDDDFGDYWSVRYRPIDQSAMLSAQIARITSANTGHEEANALLMAAAPDLLHVAQFILRGMEGGHIKCAGYFDFDPDAESLEIKHPSDMLRAALAKAGASHA